MGPSYQFGGLPIDQASMKDTENADFEQISDNGSAAGSTIKKSKTKKKKKKKVADEVE